MVQWSFNLVYVFNWQEKSNEEIDSRNNLPKIKDWFLVAMKSLRFPNNH